MIKVQTTGKVIKLQFNRFILDITSVQFINDRKKLVLKNMTVKIILALFFNHPVFHTYPVFDINS